MTFRLHADGTVLTPASMDRSGEASWRAGGIEVALETSTTPDGSTATTLVATGVRRVHEVCLLDRDVDGEIHNHRWFDLWGMQQSTVVFVRRGPGGEFFCYANPFGVADVDGRRLRLAYRPGVDVDGTFRSDPLVSGSFVREGVPVRRELHVGRDLTGGKVPAYAGMLGPHPVELDRGEVRAVRAAVTARVPWEPARTRVAHWDWSENLYRLPIDEPGTRAMYDRVLAVAGEIGVQVVLVAPSHRAGYVHGRSGVDRAGAAPVEGSEVYGDTALGPWQAIMWLGMGDAFGRGVWEPGAEPAGLDGIFASAKRHRVGVAAYANPQYLWERRDDWALRLDPDAADPWGGAYRPCCLGHREVQDWLVEHAPRFARAYGLAGFSIDFVSWFECHATDHGHDPGPASVYAQWHGYRRVLRALREDDPDAWVEGLIGSPQLMPWGATEMVHPCPMMGDNQPQWVPAWPDPSQYRALGNYQRRCAYWYRNLAFVPSYKVPSLVHHQGNRIRWPEAERGWDWEGARYGLLSAIASAPSTLLVCFLPGWDEDEWRAMRERDAAFYREWIGFARDNAAVLSRMEDLFEEPRPGAVDGTIALGDDGRGFVFLANPDFVAHEVEVPHVLRELHPSEGRLWSGRVTVEPHQVAVLEVVAEVAYPALVGVSGRADQRGRVVEASGVPGTEVGAEVWLGPDDHREVRIRFEDDGIRPTLGPWRGGATGWAPGTALPDLLASLAPGVPPAGDEVLQPWSDPSRLRLFLDIVDPSTVKPAVRVDGDDVPVAAAYMGTYEDVKDTDLHPLENNLLGWYVDLTDRMVATDDLSRPWRIEVDVPGAFDGQLRGVHVAHLPRRTTDRFTVVGAEAP